MASGRMSYDEEARYRMNALAVEGAGDGHYAYDQPISSPDLGPAAPAFDGQPDPSAFETFEIGYAEHPHYEEDNTVYQQPGQEQTVNNNSPPQQAHARVSQLETLAQQPTYPGAPPMQQPYPQQPFPRPTTGYRSLSSGIAFDNGIAYGMMSSAGSAVEGSGDEASEGGEPENAEVADGESDDGATGSFSNKAMKRKAAVEVQGPRKRAARTAREVVTLESDAEDASDDNSASDGNKHRVVKTSRSGNVVRFEVPYPAPPGKTWVAPVATGPRKDKPWLRSDSAKGALDSNEAPQANSSLPPNVPLTGAESCMIFVNNHWPPILKRLQDAGYTTKEIAAANLYSHDMATPEEIIQRDRAIRKQVKHTLGLPVATDFGTASFKPNTDRRPLKADLLTRFGDNMGYFPPAEEQGIMTKGIYYALEHPDLQLTVNDLERLAKERDWQFPHDSTKAPAEADAAGRVQLLKMMEEDGVRLTQKGRK
ncbi:hypothetical protein LTR97_004970 [Elasticomyces elasticus]|uniref:Uncharacterized protein n=1 Tax=Elasticomyces elasticus TaxID=574655 RepID=A0AAN7WJF0_9PEZI|nr:hypothetical protein LTR97_004970 [Elasticomyces elasticus]